MARNVAGRLGLVLAIALLAGCGGGGDGPEFGVVNGKVTLNGATVTSGTVEFIPDNSKDTMGPKSAGQINQNGEFTLTAPGGKQGAMVGHHKVAVSCPPELSGMGSSSGSESGAAKAPTQKPAGAEAQGGCPIPARYADSSTSGITQEVKAGSNDITLELSLN